MSFDISSAGNDRIKRLVRLRDRRHRDAEGVFVAEGSRLVSRAIDAGLDLVEVYVDRTVDIDLPIAPVTVAPAVLDKASYRNRSQGVVAVFRQFETSLDSVDPGEDGLVIAAEAIEKPGNLGALARIADAVGADGLLIVSGGADPFNPNALRSSTGAVFSVPMARCEIAELGAWTALHSLDLVAVEPLGGEPVWDADLAQPLCLLVGSEGTGLSEAAARVATARVSIPMAGSSDSLNVATATAVAAFEVVRQRSR